MQELPKAAAFRLVLDAKVRDANEKLTQKQREAIAILENPHSKREDTFICILAGRVEAYATTYILYFLLND